MTTTTLPASLTIRALGDEPAILITTPARDLMRDTLDPIGMAIESYLNGTRAVHLFHDHGRLPIAKTVSLTKSPQGIVARFRWLEANPEARVVRDVFEEGVLGASVEFVPVDAEPNRAGGMHYAKTVLTGWALTANPANPQCTRLMKSLGLDRDDAPVLVLVDDEDDRVTFAPQDLAAAFQTVVEARVHAEVDRQRRGLWGVPPPASPLVVDVDGATRRVDPDTLKAAMAEAFGLVVQREVGAAVRRLTGRVD